jgi:AcrR family transcriptional regulator
MTKRAHPSETRQHILSAALKRFAHSGYAAASIQQIVDEARVSKPALYYHFQDKAGLFQALVNEAHDREFDILRDAASRAKHIREQLVEILIRLFEYFQKNRDLTRIALATMFAAPGEMPPGLRYLDRCKRNFEVLHVLMKRALRSGELDSRFGSRELAFGFYGQANVHLMAHLLMPTARLNRRTAVRIVELFLAGAAAKKQTGRPVSPDALPRLSNK